MFTKSVERIPELLSTLVALAGLALAGIIMLRVSPVTSPEITQRISFIVIVSILFLNSMQSLMAIFARFMQPPISSKTKTRSQNLETRLGELTSALTDAGRIISAIEVEIHGRQELVSRLERQKVLAERAIELSREQVDAVSALLSEHVTKQSKKDQRLELLRDVLFFFAGVLITILLSSLGITK